MVIVWLLYGYCVVRKKDFKSIGDVGYRQIIVGLRIMCKDTIKFSNLQILENVFLKNGNFLNSISVKKEKVTKRKKVFNSRKLSNEIFLSLEKKNYI